MSAISSDTLRTAQAQGELVTKSDLREMELRLTIKLGSLIAGGIGIIAALLKFSH